VNKVLWCKNVLKETTKICHQRIVFRNNSMFQDLSKRESRITEIHFNFESHPTSLHQKLYTPLYKGMVGMYTYGQFEADRITSELHECE
jgi:hypothetical protein